MVVVSHLFLFLEKIWDGVIPTDHIVPFSWAVINRQPPLIFNCVPPVRLWDPPEIYYFLCFAQYSRMFMVPVSIQNAVCA